MALMSASFRPFRLGLRWAPFLFCLPFLLFPELLRAQEEAVSSDTQVRSCFQDPVTLYPGRSTYWLLADYEDPAQSASARLATQGVFQVQRRGGQVAATIVVSHTTGAPLSKTESDPTGRGTPTLFTVPTGFRPLHTITRRVGIRTVRPDGSLWPPESSGTSWTLELQVDPVGAVRYRDVTKVASLANNNWGTPGDRWGFILDTTWVTATSAQTGSYSHPREPQSHYLLRRQSETVAATLSGRVAPVPRLSQSAEASLHLASRLPTCYPRHPGSGGLACAWGRVSADRPDPTADGPDVPGIQGSHCHQIR